jgi:anti-sigma factor RsiW
MAREEFSDQQLLAYLDEQLPVEEMTAIEKELRDSESLRLRVGRLIQQREQGQHTVGAIWRRHRLSCPTRSQLGEFLLGTLDEGMANYLEFHLTTAGCRYCGANLDDLREAMAETPETERRRRKYFESSAGLLRSSD